MEHQNQTSEVKRALQEKVLLDDGRLGYVFSELVPIGPSNRWHCHVCSRTLDSERALVMHLSHPYHTTKLRICEHPARNFPKFADRSSEGSTKKDRSPIIKTEVIIDLMKVVFYGTLMDGDVRPFIKYFRKNSGPQNSGGQSSWEMTTDVLPGEPVPPGMEDVVEGVCQIQSTFDEHPGPLIGLEYIVELVTSEEESEPRYICLLCEKKGDPRSLMVHVTSQNHCLKYIVSNDLYCCEFLLINEVLTKLFI
uniref:C2H2-type domain-containing protein n=1 Tax=Rhodnius prolixus TaxID=13249 RepID=T1HY41_RHOPR